MLHSRWDGATTGLFRSSLGFVVLAALVLGCDPGSIGDEPVSKNERALTAPLFGPFQSYEIASWPAAVAIGDLNGDGRNDVAMAGSFFMPSNVLFVFIQAADGTLQPFVSYSAGARPTSVDIGDVNGDGRADVVIGNFDGASVGVLLQNASGTLDAMSAYPTVNAYKVKIGDFNSDGRNDIVAINWGDRGDGIDMFLQTTVGGLAAPITYHAGHGGYDDLGAGDVNGDGRIDVVIMSGQGYDYPNLAILPQNADGTLAAPAYYNVGDNAFTHGVGVGDTNGDGLDDVVVSHGGIQPDSFIARFPQNGGGTLDAAVSYASYDMPLGVVVADVTSDGRKDVVVMHQGKNSVGVYRQTASGELDAEELYNVPSVSQWNPQAFAVGDINSDGRPDVVVADITGLQVLLHVEDIPPQVAVTSPAPGRYFSLLPITVAWTASDNVALAAQDVTLSTDGGTSYHPLPGCEGLTASSRSCVWANPGPAGLGQRIRVTARDTAGNVAFAETVIDLVDPAITVAAPAGGATLTAGTPATIAWTSNLPPTDTVRIDLSRDGGLSLVNLAAAVPNTGSFIWNVTGPATTKAVIQINWNGPVGVAGRSAPFTVATPPPLAVTWPTAGASWTIKTTHAITWASTLPPTGNVRIALSRDGGTTFTNLAKSVPNSGRFDWTAAGAATSNAIVRITWLGTPAVAATGGPFALVPAVLTVTSPNTAVIWTIGTVGNITWTHDLGADAKFRIDLTRDGGSSWTTIADGVSSADAGSGLFPWTVSGPRTDRARVRITWTTNTTVTDKSDVAFKIH